MAPSLPTAAQKPCATPLTLLGKHSPGMMNVVAWKGIQVSKLSPMMEELGNYI